MNTTIKWLGMLLVLTAMAPDGPPKDKDQQIGRTFQVPYQVTNTNHYLVRVRINGKGPFNFLVDSGAPALFVGTEAAKKIGIKVDEENFWTDIDRIDLEGGASLTDVKGRVEDPFQLIGMNALGLPGASIDGILGFTILARFRMEFDPTKDRMAWTRIDYEPKEPFVPKLAKGQKAEPSAEVQLMQAMGPAMKLAAVFLGKQPEVERVARGSLGVELKEGAVVAAVVAGSAAERAGIRAGDRLAKILDRAVGDTKDAHEAVAKLRAGDDVPIVVERDGQTIEITAKAGEGF
jgi:hypothetical protein